MKKGLIFFRLINMMLALRYMTRRKNKELLRGVIGFCTSLKKMYSRNLQIT